MGASEADGCSWLQSSIEPRTLSRITEAQAIGPRQYNLESCSNGLYRVAREKTASSLIKVDWLGAMTEVVLTLLNLNLMQPKEVQAESMGLFLLCLRRIILLQQ